MIKILFRLIHCAGLSGLLLLPVVISAQSQRQTVYSAVPNCVVQGFVPLQGGGNLLAGYSRYGNDSSLINLAFLNDSDVIVSHKEFNTATHFDFMSCIVPAGNGFLIGGKSSDTGFFHPQLIKTDLNGSVLWAKYFDNTSFWHSQIMRIIPNGNSFSMYTYAETPSNDLFRIETDANGNMLAGYQVMPVNPMSFRIFDAEPLVASSSHILCGHANFNTSTTRGGFLMQTNPSGVDWGKHITAGGNFKNDIVDVTTAAGGNSFSLFVCENMPGNQYSTIVLKFDSLGNKVWAKQLAINNGTLNGCSIIESTSHEFYIAAYDNLLKAYIIKMTDAGNVLWTRKWQPSTAGGATALRLFKDVSGNLVFTGTLGNSYFVSRLDADAAGCSFTDTTLLNVTNATTVITDVVFQATSFTATSVAENTTYSFLQYSESMICGGLGVNEIETAIPLSVYPNPAGRELFFKNLIHGRRIGSAGVFSIYNAVGEKLIERKLFSTSEPETRMNISQLIPGIYFIRLDDGEKIYSGKFIKE